MPENTHVASPGRRRRAWPMHFHLTTLVLLVILPQLVLGSLISFRYARDARAAVEDSTRRLAASFSDTLDRFLEGAVASIETLAITSDPGDLATLDARARKLLPIHGTAASMRDKDGQQLLNTTVPFGTPLPRTASETVRRADAEAFRTGKPVFSDLYHGTVSHKWFFLIDVPLIEEGKPNYALNLAVSSDDLRRTMFRGLPAGWSAAVVDRNSRVMARAVNQNKFVGQPATGDLAEKIRSEGSGSLQSITLDGVDVFASFVSSPSSGYTVVVSAPRAILDKPVRDLWINLTGLGILAVASSSLAAWWWSKRMVSSLTELETAALAGGAGVSAQIHSPVEEFNSVAQSISKAAAEIRDRTGRQDRLIAELNHRVKNTLAVLQAITLGTVKTRSDRDVSEALRFRIHGLSAAHDLLNAHEWENVDIAKILEAVSSITAHACASVSGPRVVLNPKAVVAFCQVFIELAEGAIFCEVDQSEAAWFVDQERLTIRWLGVCDPHRLQEADPFSLRIISLCIERQLAGRFEFRRTGDHWEWICSVPLKSDLGIIGKLA